jgi:hypothetical protein
MVRKLSPASASLIIKIMGDISHTLRVSPGTRSDIKEIVSSIYGARQSSTPSIKEIVNEFRKEVDKIKIIKGMNLGQPSRGAMGAMSAMGMAMGGGFPSAPGAPGYPMTAGYPSASGFPGAPAFP